MSTAPAPTLETLLAAFVGDARVRMALVLERSGRVVAQHGFTRRVDVMSASALAAAIGASAGELGRMLGGMPFGPLHHAGSDRQLFLAPLPGQFAPLLLLAVFDDDTSLGVVRVVWMELASALERSLPPLPPETVAPADFEGELQRSLTALFANG
jgi:hypothetical protein